MPVKKRGESRKNLTPEERNDRVVPKKEEAGKKAPRKGNDDKVAPRRVNALATQGKKKKPK